MTFGVITRPKPPEGYVGLWVNIYKHSRFQTGGAYRSRRQADDIAKKYRYDCIFIFVKKKVNDSSSTN